MLSTRKSLFSLASATILLLLTVGAQATTYYVNVNTGSDSNPGTIGLPFKSIQKGITSAPAASTLLVASGTYHESLSWVGKNLTIQGAGAGLSIIDPSIANGGPGGRCLLTQNLPSTTVSQIVGFTFQNGTTSYPNTGGGMFIYLSNLTVTQCTFSSNGSSYDGGGMYNLLSNTTITQCTFSNNYAEGIGGGIGSYDSNPTITNCMFIQNRASDNGGGMCNFGGHATVTGCTFTENQSETGGGMFTDNTSGISATVLNCTFSNNTASYNGGGMAYDCYASVTNCSFTKNTATDVSGGGIYSLGTNTSSISTTVTNCTFTQNKAAENGGGMCNYGSRITVTNCTFSNNSASFYGGAIYESTTAGALTAVNCILWGNTATYSGYGIDGAASVTYSDVQGGWSGAGNFSADPLFVNASTGNLRLQSGSPCRDRGLRGVVLAPPFFAINGIILDLDGNPRIFGASVDLGAYEYQ